MGIKETRARQTTGTASLRKHGLEMQEQVNIINKRWCEVDTACGQDREVGSYNCYGQN